MKKIISLFFFSFIYNLIYSQGLKEITEYEFEKYAVEEGTAMNASLVVFEDTYGYIWLGSQSGVDRFDGYDFKNFANVSSDSTSTNLKWVNAITEDSNGNIWATDQFGNVSNYRRAQDKWINYYPIYKDSITNIPEGANLDFAPQPSSIVVTRDGRYAFVGVFGFGLIRIDSETGSQKFYQDDYRFPRTFDINSADKMINEMEWFDDDNILIATGDGLRVFNINEEKYTKEFLRTKKKSLGEDFPDDRYWIRKFEIIDKNNLWLAAKNGIIFKYSIDTEILENFSSNTDLSNVDATNILFDKDKNQLWVTIDNVGIDILDANTNKVVNLRNNNSAIIGKEFNNVIKDSQNNIWISSATDGLLKFDPNKKKFSAVSKDYPRKMNLGFSIAWGAHIDREGIVWVGTRDPGGGIVGLDFKNNKRYYSGKTNNNSALVYSITEDNAGNIWAIRGTNSIWLKKKNEDRFKWLGNYNRNLRKDKSFFNILTQGHLTYDKNLIVPSDRTVWLADSDGNPVYEEYTTLTNLLKDKIRAFSRKDSTSSYVIADKSIWLWNEKKNTITDLTPELDVPIFESFAQAPVAEYKNKIYIPTYGNGIMVVNIETQKISYLTINEGLPNMYLYNMFIDIENNLWMSSNKGILKYNPDNLEFSQYTPVDGTQEYEYNAGTAWQSDDGFIVMGGLNGINYFNPSKLDENRLPPKVLIQNIIIGGEKIQFESVSNNVTDEIEFRNNSISFEYLALSYRNTKQNQYKYKMEGYDTDWIEAEDRRFASYTNLPIGSYTFRVQGSNNDGIWNEVGASYKLIILPPWYRTYTAYASYLILLVFGFRFFGKYQAQKSLEYADNKRRAGELEEAKNIQDGMLPKEFPSSKSFDVSAGLVTSTEIGGDYYDFFENNKSLYAVCGDATGHGTSSGMMVSIIKSGLNGLPALTTDKVLYELNNIVKKINLGTLKMSLNICEVTNNSITLSSAAMPPIYLYNSQSKKTEEILIRGLPLGGLKNEKFDVEKRKFNKGDVLVLLSDGLPEAENSSGELYDYERVIKLINENATKSAEEIKNKLIGEVDIWLDGNVPEDDVTFVIIKKI